jgi:serine/threonine-protein kinase
LGPGEVIVLVLFLATGGKVLREFLRWRHEHSREQRKLDHELKLAQIQAGLLPGTAEDSRQIAELQRGLQDLNKERVTLQERIEHLETVVTSASMEVNLRLNRLLADALPPAAGLASIHDPTLSVERLAASASRESRIGERFAERYELLAELGRGGMGIVYQAQDTKLGQIVTLKVLSPMVSRDRRALDRFRHEASATRRINHPNVIRIYDLGEWGAEPYISMEYFAGLDLKQRLRTEGSLPQKECVRILLAVAEGIRAAHEQGVIHRDLKPQNILLGHTGQVKVIDFGLAKSTLMGGLTVSGFILGTPQYMSPEQIQGKEIDPRSDIYSLGVVAYEMRSGHTPFAGESPIEVSFKTIQEPHRPLRSLAPETSAHYEQMVERCLQKSPTGRYQRMEEVLEDLRKLA